MGAEQLCAPPAACISWTLSVALYCFCNSNNNNNINKIGRGSRKAHTAQCVLGYGFRMQVSVIKKSSLVLILRARRQVEEQRSTSDRSEWQARAAKRQVAPDTYRTKW